jgi:hypothetical protein
VNFKIKIIKCLITTVGLSFLEGLIESQRRKGVGMLRALCGFI